MVILVRIRVKSYGQVAFRGLILWQTTILTICLEDSYLLKSETTVQNYLLPVEKSGKYGKGEKIWEGGRKYGKVGRKVITGKSVIFLRGVHRDFKNALLPGYILMQLS
jgi:hypothetical protein